MTLSWVRSVRQPSQGQVDQSSHRFSASANACPEHVSYGGGLRLRPSIRNALYNKVETWPMARDLCFYSVFL